MRCIFTSHERVLANTHFKHELLTLVFIHQQSSVSLFRILALSYSLQLLSSYTFNVWSYFVSNVQIYQTRIRLYPCDEWAVKLHDWKKKVERAFFFSFIFLFLPAINNIVRENIPIWMTCSTGMNSKRSSTILKDSNLDDGIKVSIQKFTRSSEYA